MTDNNDNQNENEQLSPENQAIYDQAKQHGNNGISLYKEGKFDDAVVEYTKAIEIFEKTTQQSNDFKKLISSIYQNKGIVHFDKRLYDSAIKDYNKAIELNQNDAGAYVNRGNVYAAQEKYDNALSDLNRAIELNQNIAEAYVNRGNVYLNKEEYDSAIKDYNKAIALNPNSILAYVGMGNTYISKREYDKAIKSYDKAIELSPNNPLAYYNKGTTYYSQNEFDKAIENFNKVIELDKNHIQAYWNRGNSYSEKKEFDKAIQDFSKAIEILEKITPQNEYIKYAITQNYYNRGNTYSAELKFNKAINDFNKAIELDENFISAYYNRGTAYGKKGEYNKAIKDYDKAIELNANSADPYHNRGTAYKNKGEFENAIKDYDKAIEILSKIIPQNDYIINNILTACYNKAVAYNQAGKYNKAIETYDSAIEYNKLKSNKSALNKILLLIGKANVYIAKSEQDIEKIQETYNNLTYKNSKKNNENQNSEFCKELSDELKTHNINLFENTNIDEIEKIYSEIYDSLLDNIGLNEIPSDTIALFRTIRDRIHNSSKVAQDRRTPLLNVLRNLFIATNMLRIPTNRILSRYMAKVETFNNVFGNPSSTFRLNSANAMNDVLEGHILYKYIYDNPKYMHDKRRENVFLASFTENENDAMQMWQTTYANGCKGISYSFRPSDNIFNAISTPQLDGISTNLANILNVTSQLNYYRVAYLTECENQERCPVSDNCNNANCNREYEFNVFYNHNNIVTRHAPLSNRVTRLFNRFKEEYNQLSQEERNLIQPALSFTSHLIKYFTWHYENEVRLIHVADNYSENTLTSDTIQTYDWHDMYFDTEQPLNLSAVRLSPLYNPERLYNNETQNRRIRDKHIEYYNRIFEGQNVTAGVSRHIYKFTPDEPKIPEVPALPPTDDDTNDNSSNNDNNTTT